MVNSHDPVVVQRDYTTLIHLMHFLDGVFLWEFFTSMKFEWEHLTGKKKFKWTLLLYSWSRICAVGGTICNLIGFNVTHSINCQQWITWNLIFNFASFTCASMLNTLRVIAVWNCNIIIAVLVFGMGLASIGFLVYGVTTVRSGWSTTCYIEKTNQFRNPITVSLFIHIAQLIIMLIGLLRCHRTRSGIVRFLYIQGLMCFLAATLAEIPSAVFVNLNLNDPSNFMFQYFSLYAMVICATRMYRNLISYNMDVHKYSIGPVPEVVSTMRFEMASGPRTATTTCTSTTPSLPSTCIDITHTYVDFKATVPEKRISDRDEEAQLREIPSLTTPPESMSTRDSEGLVWIV
ncbi:hypothetical protein BC827DRAFT_179781 [Russula dissimulans]|nr:hypothetical protein BC827DRAFT_179781 [Russula dissimulans]